MTSYLINLETIRGHADDLTAHDAGFATLAEALASPSLFEDPLDLPEIEIEGAGS